MGSGRRVGCRSLVDRICSLTGSHAGRRATHRRSSLAVGAAFATGISGCSSLTDDDDGPLETGDAVLVPPGGDGTSLDPGTTVELGWTDPETRQALVLAAHVLTAESVGGLCTELRLERPG